MVAEGKCQRRMRGKPQAQPEFLTTINLNQRVPADHPLRGIKERVDKVLVKLAFWVPLSWLTSQVWRGLVFVVSFPAHIYGYLLARTISDTYEAVRRYQDRRSCSGVHQGEDQFWLLSSRAFSRSLPAH